VKSGEQYKKIKDKNAGEQLVAFRETCCEDKPAPGPDSSFTKLYTFNNRCVNPIYYGTAWVIILLLLLAVVILPLVAYLTRKGESAEEGDSEEEEDDEEEEEEEEGGEKQPLNSEDK
jgi:flagellar biosynthesis/type III secretory pathway M-ring protein FliF/YscJ